MMKKEGSNSLLFLDIHFIMHGVVLKTLYNRVLQNIRSNVRRSHEYPTRSYKTWSSKIINKVMENCQKPEMRETNS